MKKNNKVIKVTLVALLLIAFILVGYTFSKYSKSYTAQTSSTVAKWKFGGEIFNAKNSSTVSTISLADTIENPSIKNGRIAPGTNGDFTIVIDGTGSEVDLDYSVELVKETSKPQNLKFSCNGNSYASLKELIAGEADFKGKINFDDLNMKKEILVEWEWPYETMSPEGTPMDEVDNEDGKNISNYEFSLKINGTQSI